jgi:hypothetical protein
MDPILEAINARLAALAEAEASDLPPITDEDRIRALESYLSAVVAGDADAVARLAALREESPEMAADIDVMVAHLASQPRKAPLTAPFTAPVREPVESFTSPPRPVERMAAPFAGDVEAIAERDYSEPRSRGAGREWGAEPAEPLPETPPNTIAGALYGPNAAALAMRPGESSAEFERRRRRGRIAAAEAEAWARRVKIANDPTARGATWMLSR